MLNPDDNPAAVTISPTVTSFTQADAIVQQLAAQKNPWTQVRIPHRLVLLEQCMAGVAGVADAWAEAACLAKGLDPASPIAGEEWLIGPAVTLANLRQLIRALTADGQPQPLKLERRNEPAIATVFPATWMEALLFRGFRGEVWLEPGCPRTQGRIYREPTATGNVALVLGAGNVSSIAPMDVLYKLFVENSVVVLKLNPVNDYMGGFLAQAFAPLCEAGVLAIVQGGADLGRFLCQHPQIDTLHITGSQQTHDAIVWGDTRAEQLHQQALGQPRNAKPITSELGCVTPVLVVPGNWSEADLRFQARHVAGMVTHNASFNCAAAQVLVTAKGWAQRSRFLTLLQQELTQTPGRAAYYPGAELRYQAFLQRYPQAIVLQNGHSVPWTLIPDVPARSGEYAFTQEAFCGILAEVNLNASEPAVFLTQAVEFVNAQVWGNLSCTVLIHPETQRRCQKQWKTAIASLHYGAIGVNVWSGVIYSLPALSWGAFPGNPLTAIASGRGVTHNTYLFDHPQKSVLIAPFRIRPLPSWLPRHKTLRQLARRFTQLQAMPSLENFLSVVIAALQG